MAALISANEYGARWSAIAAALVALCDEHGAPPNRFHWTEVQRTACELRQARFADPIPGWFVQRAGVNNHIAGEFSLPCGSQVSRGWRVRYERGWFAVSVAPGPESLSYGVRCNDCGEYETACRC